MKIEDRKELEIQRLREENNNLRASLNSCKTAFKILLKDEKIKLSNYEICNASIREIQRNLK